MANDKQFVQLQQYAAQRTNEAMKARGTTIADQIGNYAEHEARDITRNKGGILMANANQNENIIQSDTGADEIDAQSKVIQYKMTEGFANIYQESVSSGMSGEDSMAKAKAWQDSVLSDLVYDKDASQADRQKFASAFTSFGMVDSKGNTGYIAGNQFRRSILDKNIEQIDEDKVSMHNIADMTLAGDMAWDAINWAKDDNYRRDIYDDISRDQSMLINPADFKKYEQSIGGTALGLGLAVAEGIALGLLTGGLSGVGAGAKGVATGAKFFNLGKKAKLINSSTMILHTVAKGWYQDATENSGAKKQYWGGGLKGDMKAHWGEMLSSRARDLAMGVVGSVAGAYAEAGASAYILSGIENKARAAALSTLGGALADTAVDMTLDIASHNILRHAFGTTDNKVFTAADRDMFDLENLQMGTILGHRIAGRVMGNAFSRLKTKADYKTTVDKSQTDLWGSAKWHENNFNLNSPVKDFFDNSLLKISNLVGSSNFADLDRDIKARTGGKQSLLKMLDDQESDAGKTASLAMQYLTIESSKNYFLDKVFHRSGSVNTDMFKKAKTDVMGASDILTTLQGYLGTKGVAKLDENIKPSDMTGIVDTMIKHVEKQMSNGVYAEGADKNTLKKAIFEVKAFMTKQLDMTGQEATEKDIFNRYYTELNRRVLGTNSDVADVSKFAQKLDMDTDADPDIANYINTTSLDAEVLTQMDADFVPALGHITSKRRGVTQDQIAQANERIKKTGLFESMEATSKAALEDKSIHALDRWLMQKKTGMGIINDFVRLLSRSEGQIDSEADFITMQKKLNEIAPHLVKDILNDIEYTVRQSTDEKDPESIDPETKAQKLFIDIMKLQSATSTFGPKVTAVIEEWKSNNASGRIIEETGRLNRDIIKQFGESTVKDDAGIQKNMLQYVVENSINQGIHQMINTKKISNLLDGNASFMMNAVDALRYNEELGNDHRVDKASAIIANAQLEASNTYFRTDSERAFTKTVVGDDQLKDVDEMTVNTTVSRLSSNPDVVIPQDRRKDFVNQKQLENFFGLTIRKRVSEAALEYADDVAKGNTTEPFKSYARRKVVEYLDDFPELEDKLFLDGAYFDIIEKAVNKTGDINALANAETTENDVPTFIIRTGVGEIPLDKYHAWAKDQKENISALATSAVDKTARLKQYDTWATLPEAEADDLLSKNLNRTYSVRGSKHYEAVDIVEEIASNNPAKDIVGDISIIVESTFSARLDSRSAATGLELARDRVASYLREVAPAMAHNLEEQGELNRLATSLAMVARDHQDIAVSTFQSNIPMVNGEITTAKEAIPSVNNIYRGKHYTMMSVGTDDPKGMSGISPDKLLKENRLVQLFAASSTLESALVKVKYYGDDDPKNRQVTSIVDAVVERFEYERVSDNSRLFSEDEKAQFIADLKEVSTGVKKDGSAGRKAENITSATKRVYTIVADYLMMKNQRFRDQFEDYKIGYLPDTKTPLKDGFPLGSPQLARENRASAAIAKADRLVKYAQGKSITEFDGLLKELSDGQAWDDLGVTIAEDMKDLTDAVNYVKTKIENSTEKEQFSSGFMDDMKNLAEDMRRRYYKYNEAVKLENKDALSMVHSDMTRTFDEIKRDWYFSEEDFDEFKESVEGSGIANSALAVTYGKLESQHKTIQKWKDDALSELDGKTEAETLKWAYSLAAFGQNLMVADYVPKRGASLAIASPNPEMGDKQLAKIWDDKFKGVIPEEEKPRVIVISSKSYNGGNPGDGVMQFPQWLYNYFAAASGGIGTKVNYTYAGSLFKIMGQTNKSLVQRNQFIQDTFGNRTTIRENDIVLNSDNIKTLSPEFLAGFGLDQISKGTDTLKSGTALVATYDADNTFVKDFVLGINRHSDFDSKAKDINLSTQQANTDPFWGSLYKSMYGSQRIVSAIEANLSKVAKVDMIKDPNKWINQLQSIIRRGIKISGGLTIAMPQEGLRDGYDSKLLDDPTFRTKNRSLYTNNNVTYSHNYFLSTIEAYMKDEYYTSGVNIKKIDANKDENINRSTFELGRDIHKMMVDEDLDIGSVTPGAIMASTKLSDRQKAKFRELTPESQADLINGKLMLEMMSDDEHGFFVKDTTGKEPVYMVMSTRFPAQNKAQTQFFALAGIRRANVHEGIELAPYYYEKMLKGDYDGDRPMVMHIPRNRVVEAAIKSEGGADRMGLDINQPGRLYDWIQN